MWEAIAIGETLLLIVGVAVWIWLDMTSSANCAPAKEYQFEVKLLAHEPGSPKPETLIVQAYIATCENNGLCLWDYYGNLVFHSSCYAYWRRLPLPPAQVEAHAHE